MRKLSMRILLALLVLAAFALIGSWQASAGTLYHWVTDDGTYSFTDDPDHVPAHYQAKARKQETKSLSSFERYSPTDAAAQATYRQELAKRLERLRALNGFADPYEPPPAPAPVGYQVPVAAAAPQQPGYEAIVEVNDSTSLRVPTTGDGKGPIVVEERRVRRPGNITTVHDTVVRQGDQVLMIVRPDNSHEASASDITDERRLFR